MNKVSRLFYFQLGASFTETAKNLYSQQCLNFPCVDIEEDGVRHTRRPHLHVAEEEAMLTCCAVLSLLVWLRNPKLSGPPLSMCCFVPAREAFSVNHPS